ncbi:MAG: type II toxin-antitoxin system RelE/ParE family toxin [Actinomycetota bacterium]
MRVEFADDGLRRLYEEPAFHDPKLGPDVTKQFRKKVNFLIAAHDERDLRNYKALHFEKLAGSRTGQSSIRLNDQWRLILRIKEDEQGRLIVVVEIVDYH